MGRRASRKAKTVSYRLIPRNAFDLLEASLYAALHELIEKHHSDLRNAKIALAWCTSWKADVDGRMTIGKCRRASDLDRELSDFDFIILLSQTFCLYATDDQRRALIDHELCHAALKTDKYGEPVEDERGRKVYRTRRHDLEEFACIVERHGTYKRDLALFAQAMARSAPLRAAELQKNCTVCSGSGMRELPTDTGGAATMTRCDCWLKGQELIRIANGELKKDETPAPADNQPELLPQADATS